jgi:tetratricopeptide (TPR) repeat protein
MWTKSDFARALRYYEIAHSLAESIGYPTHVGEEALNNICNILIITGKPLRALKCAKEAHRCAEHIGNIYGQASSLSRQARCHIILANYRCAQHLLQISRDIMTACGQQQSALRLGILNYEAEIHLVKSEYLESRNLQVTLASCSQPTSYIAIMANLNVAFIDIAIGADSKDIRQNLDIARSHLKALYGRRARETGLIADYGAAELCLRDGPVAVAREMFERFLVLSQDFSTDVALYGLGRLGDLSTGMNDTPTTLRWAGIFLGMALNCKDKLCTMQAFRCLGQIYSAESDDETALSLFKAALDGFSFMDVHRWRADCMVRIADILNTHGEVVKAVELWKAAKPLFERSSQMKDILKIDAKLAAVDSAVLVEYQEQLQQLSELHIPVGAPEETYVVEDEEEEKLAQDSDIGNEEKQGVLV